MHQSRNYSVAALTEGAILLTLLLGGSQVAIGGSWAWFGDPSHDRGGGAAVAVAGSFLGGLALRIWRWPAASAAALMAFAVSALAWIAWTGGSEAVARAWGPWFLPWPVMIARSALMLAGMAALGVFAAEVLVARRKNVPWRTRIPPRLVGLGPSVLGAVIYFLLLVGARAAEWPDGALVFVGMFLAVPAAIGLFIRDYWWAPEAPLTLVAFGLYWGNVATVEEDPAGLSLLLPVFLASPATGTAALGVDVARTWFGSRA